MILIKHDDMLMKYAINTLNSYEKKLAIELESIPLCEETYLKLVHLFTANRDISKARIIDIAIQMLYDFCNL